MRVSGHLLTATLVLAVVFAPGVSARDAGRPGPAASHGAPYAIPNPYASPVTTPATADRAADAYATGFAIGLGSALIAKQLEDERKRQLEQGSGRR